MDLTPLPPPFSSFASANISNICRAFPAVMAAPDNPFNRRRTSSPSGNFSGRFGERQTSNPDMRRFVTNLRRQFQRATEGR